MLKNLRELLIIISYIMIKNILYYNSERRKVHCLNTDYVMNLGIKKN